MQNDRNQWELELFTLLLQGWLFMFWRWQPPHRLVVGMAMPHHDNAWQDMLCWSCSARHMVGTAMLCHDNAWQDTLCWSCSARHVVVTAMPCHNSAWQDTLCWSCSARHVVGTAMPRHNSAWQDTLLVLLSKAPDKIRVSRCMADMQPHAAQLCTVGRVGLTDSCSNKKSFTCGTCLAAAHLISGWGHFLCVVVD